MTIDYLLGVWQHFPGKRRENAGKKLMAMGIKVTPKPEGGAKVECLTAQAYGLLIGEALSMRISKR